MACIKGSRTNQAQPNFTVVSDRNPNYLLPPNTADRYVNSLIDPSKALIAFKQMQAIDRLTGSFPDQCYEIGTMPKWAN